MKTNIIPYEISSYIKPLKSCFSKPQFEHFCAYIIGLINCKRKTVNSISMEIGSKDQSSLNRFLTRNKWNKEKPRKRILKMFKPLIITPVLICVRLLVFQQASCKKNQRV